MSNFDEVCSSQECDTCDVVAQKLWYCLEDPGGKIYMRLCVPCAWEYFQIKNPKAIESLV
jgi:hypothetical protein